MHMHSAQSTCTWMHAKYEKLAETAQNIIWLDLELTSGFYDDARACILEAAVIITDKELNELGRGHWVINGFSAEDLLALTDFHQACAFVCACA